MAPRLVSSALLALCTLAASSSLPAQSYPWGILGQEALREIDRAAAQQLRRGDMTRDEWERYNRQRQADWERGVTTPRRSAAGRPGGGYGAGPGRGMGAGPGYGRGPGRAGAGPYGPSYGPGPRVGPYGPSYGPGPYR